jgi:hypothetical protein
MDTSSVISQVEAALGAQLQLAGGDPAVAAAGEALRIALAPALRQAAMDLAGQAVAEVAAQLPDLVVELVVTDGEPGIVVRQEAPASFAPADLEARMTVRLPKALKEQLEAAAGSAGDSINTHVVKSLSSPAARQRRRRRYTGTFET